MQSERERRGEIKYRFTPVSRSSIKKDSLKADRAVQRSLMCKVNRTATPSHHHSEKKKKNKYIHTIHWSFYCPLIVWSFKRQIELTLHMSLIKFMDLLKKQIKEK